MVETVPQISTELQDTLKIITSEVYKKTAELIHDEIRAVANDGATLAMHYSAVDGISSCIGAHIGFMVSTINNTESTSKEQKDNIYELAVGVMMSAQMSMLETFIEALKGTMEVDEDELCRGILEQMKKALTNEESS